MAVSKITTPPTQKEAIDKINEIIDNMGGTIVVDQTYDGTSVNPQSGVAIAGAKFVQNNSTLPTLAIGSSATSTVGGIAIGSSSSVNYGGTWGGIAIGDTAVSTGGYSSIAIGYHATASGYASVAISAAGGGYGTASGNRALAIGDRANASGDFSIYLGGYGKASGNYSVSIGGYSETYAPYSTAIGYGAYTYGASNTSSIQLGYGDNSYSNTLNVGFYNDSNTHYNWRLLNGTTGLIPYERIDSVTDNNASGQLKFWTGTKQQYDAISTKDANTIYNVSDNSNVTLDMLELLYPVGSVYIGTMATCPLETLGIGTWQLIAEDRVLQGSSTSNTAGTTISAGLPNASGSTYPVAIRANGSTTSNVGAVAMTGQAQVNTYSSGSQGLYAGTLNTNLSWSNSIYGNSTTVQPPAYVVNIWERTA